MRSLAMRMSADAEQPALPEGTFDRAMHAHLEVTEERIRRLYVRPRALFAEAIVAALVDGTLVEFPAAAWDVEMRLPRRRRCGFRSSAPASERRSRRRNCGRPTGEG